MLKKIISMVLVALLCAGAMAAEITVQGTGEVAVKADTALIDIGVRTFADDALSAQSQVNDVIAAISAALKENGVQTSDLSTEYLSLYPNYDYSAPVTEILGYEASCTLRVRSTAMDALGALIDTAFEAGANMLSNITYGCSDTTTSTDRALELAYADAARKAQVIAAAAGYTKLTLKDITESENYNYGMTNDFAKIEAAAGTEILPAMLKTTATVTITYEAE